MTEPNFREVLGADFDQRRRVFPGGSAGAPLVERSGVLHVELERGALSLSQIWTRAGLTRGAHVVHERTVLANLERLQQLLKNTFGRPTTVAWAIKACPVRGVAKLLARAGAGADAGSLQELELALEAGISPDKIICTGVAKDDQELHRIVQVGATCVLDNLDEAEALERSAGQQGRKVHVGIRINPEVDVPTHEMVATGAIGSKFGVPVSEAEAFAEAIARHPHLTIDTVHMHLGSHFYVIDPRMLAAAINRQFELVRRLRKTLPLRRVDIGGGYRFPFVSAAQARQLGMQDAKFALVSCPDLLERFFAVLKAELSVLDSDLEIFTEPGTSIIAGAIFTLGRVLAVRDTGIIQSRIDGQHVPSGWILSTVSTSEFILKMGVPDIFYQACLVEKCGDYGFAAGIGGPLCYAGDVLTPMRTFVRIGRPARGDILCLANTGAYIGCGNNFHNLPRFPILLCDPEGGLRTLRRGDAFDPTAALES